MQFCKGKCVLDYGCGEGYGSELIKSKANSTISLDIDYQAVRTTFNRIDGNVVQADSRHSPFKSKSFDVILSFEVFEHIALPDKYLLEVSRLLKSDGLFIMSTPNVDFYSQAGMNPFHVKEYSVTEVTTYLQNSNLRINEIFAQLPNRAEVSNINSSKMLNTIMKIKRLFGFHGDILPRRMQHILHSLIAKGRISNISVDDYKFVKGKSNEAELIYIASLSS